MNSLQSLSWGLEVCDVRKRSRSDLGSALPGGMFMKTGSRVKIGIFFLVRGTLLILINNVFGQVLLLKSFSGEKIIYRLGDLKGNTLIAQEISSFIRAFCWTSIPVPAPISMTHYQFRLPQSQCAIRCSSAERK